MFTVIIAEKKHIDAIREYDFFLKPFLRTDQVVFCQWNTDARTLEEAVPELVSTVDRRSEWRLVVLCDDAGIGQKNPFDRVHFAPPQRGQEDEDAYLLRRFRAKTSAYEKAAKLPLTFLMTHLCQAPLISGGVDPGAGSARADGEPDPDALCRSVLQEAKRRSKGDYAGMLADLLVQLRALHDRMLREGYYWPEQDKDVLLQYMVSRFEAEYKEKLRHEITGDAFLPIELPKEIYCIAQRICPDQSQDISTAWNPHVENQYTQFQDWNLYFDKMRYLAVDILPENHQNYTFDYIRFLYTVLLLASHEVPGDAVRSGRVYRLNCVSDEYELRRLLVSYDGKLKATAEEIRGQIHEIRQKERRRLTDRESNALFCANSNVPVTLSQEFDVSPLFAERSGYGLSRDCPQDELGVWETSYLESEKTLFQLVKQPRRNLKRAVDNLRHLNTVDTDQVELLSDFQMEDIEEHMEHSEMSMLAVRTSDIYDMSRFRARMEEEHAKVNECIEKRMRRKSAVALASFFLCCLPMVVSNQAAGANGLFALLLALGGVALLFVTALVCLFVFRAELRRAIGDFNGVMGEICNEIQDSLVQFTRYLSNACNVMRGACVVNFRREHPDGGSLQIRVREKHLSDIDACRARLKEIFGAYLTDESCVDERLTGAYENDFSRPVDFEYPLPFIDGDRRQIEFLQAGNQITIPANFVRRVTVGLEELYD